MKHLETIKRMPFVFWALWLTPATLALSLVILWTADDLKLAHWIVVTVFMALWAIVQMPAIPYYWRQYK